MTAASGPAPIQVTPSGLSPTWISCSTLRVVGSTTVTVPLSALATSRQLAVGRDVQQAVGGAGAGRRSPQEKKAGQHRDSGVREHASFSQDRQAVREPGEAGRCHYGGRGGEMQSARCLAGIPRSGRGISLWAAA